MTDISSNTGPLATSHNWASDASRQRIKKRYGRDRWLRYFGLGAIVTALMLLAVLIASLTYTGYVAFYTTKVSLDIFLDPQKIDKQKPGKASYRRITRNAFYAYFPDVTNRKEKRNLAKILSSGAKYIVRDYVVANPDKIGQIITISLPLSDPFDQLQKGVIPREIDAPGRSVAASAPKLLNPRFSSKKVLVWFDTLVARDMLSSPFSWELFVNSDSRFPELAGLAGAFTGSLLALLVCFLISFPVGIAAAIYLEEFAPKNRLSDFIEVNINNLAAVPSVVFGLLGLAVFIGFFGLPRSVPLVGGMVLALMTLPTIIVSTRAALKAVPPSIREAALGVGASRHEVVLHHVLPLAMPGILTGTIIGLAQALGETAPLLLIGMNAFIPSIENLGLLEPATALPTQIFSWGDSPERGFVSRTSAAILVLIGFLVMMNLVAIFLRQKFERKW